MTYTLSKADRNIIGEISLNGSKSISNRALIIRALSGQDFPIDYLSTSKDTVTLQKLLSQEKIILDAGHAGTTFRFMTAYLALQPDIQVLTGSARMKQRPIGVLVEALRKLGASIDYLEQEGYPPLQINPPENMGRVKNLKISAGTSSQFISALLLIAPYLPNGLNLELEGTIVSRPYIEMTLGLMNHFGVKYKWKDQRISIFPQDYEAKPFKVEADWSAASYYYCLAAFAEKLDLQLNGLWEDSLQGDAVLVEMMQKFGIKSTFNEQGVKLTKEEKSTSNFEWDFLRCPDIAQTLAVVCSGLGTPGLFSGLETLSIKETDRIAALKTELSKVGASFVKLPPHFSKKTNKTFYMVEGKAAVDHPTFDTYEDHRMAMAFAPFSMIAPIAINDPGVVIKSYPDYWEDLKKLGFHIK